MTDYINKVTYAVVLNVTDPYKQGTYIRSNAWVIDPPSLLAGDLNEVAKRYWIMSKDGTDVIEMTENQKFVVDNDNSVIITAALRRQSKISPKLISEIGQGN